MVRGKCAWFGCCVTRLGSKASDVGRWWFSAGGHCSEAPGISGDNCADVEAAAELPEWLTAAKDAPWRSYAGAA
jgi:hypothetical protein